MNTLPTDVIYHLLMQEPPIYLNQLSRSIPAWRRVRNNPIFQRDYRRRWLNDCPLAPSQRLIYLAVFREKELFQKLLPKVIPTKPVVWKPLYPLYRTPKQPTKEDLHVFLISIRPYQDISTIQWIISLY